MFKIVFDCLLDESSTNDGAEGGAIEWSENGITGEYWDATDVGDGETGGDDDFIGTSGGWQNKTLSTKAK